MKFKAIKIKFNKTGSHKKEWHRKFTFLPVRINDEYHWLCNVYRKQMNFKGPVWDYKKYWAYIPYTSFDLMKQFDLEQQGKFEAREYTNADQKFILKHGPKIIIVFSLAMLAIGIISDSYDLKEKGSEFKTQMVQRIEKAETSDDFKSILREIINKK